MRLPDDDPQLDPELGRHTATEQTAYQAILQAEGSGVFGITGTGKSNFVKGLLDYVLEHDPTLPIVVSDMKDEYSEHGRRRPSVRLGPLQARWNAAQLATRPAILKHPGLQLAVVPMGPTAREWGRAFNLVARLLRQAELKRVLWVVEEAQYFEPYERDWLEAVATQWRDFGVILVLVSQRAGGIEVNARSQLQVFVSFAQAEPPDIDALRKRTGLTDPTYADRVARLNDGEFQLWQIGEHKNGEEEISRRRGLGVGEDENHHDRSGGSGDPVRGGENHPGEGSGAEQGQLGVQSGDVLRVDQVGVAKKPPARRHTAAAARPPATRHTAAAAAAAPSRRRFKKKQPTRSP